MTHSQNEKKSGPEPERLKIKGGWKRAVKKAMETPSPEEAPENPKKDSDDERNTTLP